MNKSVFPRPITAILLGVLGAAVGAAVMLFHAEATPESRSFIMMPGFYVWLFLLILTTSVLALSVPVVLKSLRELKGYFRANGLEILFSCIIMCLLYVIPLLPKQPEGAGVLTYQRLKLDILLGLGLIVALLAMIGMWLVSAALRAEFQEVPVDPRPIGRFQTLRDLLQRFLYVLGLLISLVTLSNGAQRNALIAAGVIQESAVPIANILIWGAYYTAMVALSYIPTYLLLREVGQRICHAYFPVSSITPESLSEWHAGRKGLEALLNMGGGIGQNLQSGIVILSPLLSGIISILLSS